MGFFKKVAKKAKKAGKGAYKGAKKGARKAGKATVKSAKQTFKGTIGKGAKKTPTLNDVLRAVKAYNPYAGITEVTRELKKDRSRGRR